MFKKLHIQLTSLCMAITGLILTILSVICLFISESGISEQEHTAFLTNLNTMYQNLELQTSLSHNWIRQMEYNYGFSIRILDNGTPLFFHSLSQDEAAEALLDQVTEQAASDFGIDLTLPSRTGRLRQQAEFSLHTPALGLCYASAAIFPRSGAALGIAVVHPLTQMNARIRQQRLFFVLADLAALLLLGIFYWHFTARMIHPLQENRQKQTQFIASASHELRSPLTVILSNIAAVKSGILPADGHFLDTIDSEGKRMSRLVGDMLQLAGADNHTWSMQPAEIEPDTLLLQTWENFESLAGARGLHWDIHLPEDAVPQVCCDPERLRQLLSILIDNAFSYTPRGGRVCLSLEWKPASGSRGGAASCLIRVIDNGPGIPDEQKQAVFERFHRLDSSRKDKSHFGLGLCIAQEIARLHKGQLLLSDTPGGGATFTLVLPAL